VGHWPVDSTAADLDGDGDNVLATANQSPEGVSVLLNNGDGTFAPARAYPAARSEDGSGPTNVVAVDFNEDEDELSGW
jgi:hypothetical protein